MAAHEPLTALGLMSGTSLDGIDAALIVSDGERVLETGPGLSVAYGPSFRARLRDCLGHEAAPPDVVRELTERHAEAVEKLLADNGLDKYGVDLIGFHGHTVLHRPRQKLTVQIGDGQLLARLCGIEVVSDFRSNDVAHGGEGAPLAPLYHAALAHDLDGPLAVLNIGGVANVTYISALEAKILAFDCGPGNALIDDWAAAAIGRPMDEGGRLARGGTVDQGRLAALLDNGYFLKPPPKSLDRDDFDIGILDGLSAADGAATLTAFTSRAVGRSGGHFPEPPKRWLVTGGGRHNATLMTALKETLGAPVDPVEAVGWDGDLLEAQAFGFLAVRAKSGLPLSGPTTTGVMEPLSGGVLHHP